MRRVSLASITALLASAAAVTVLAADAVSVSADASAERKIGRLVDRAFRHVERDRGCRFPGLPPVTFTDDPPSDRMLATLGILRRPQAANERVPDADLRDIPIDGLYRGHVRRARSATGRRFLVVPGRDINVIKPYPERCEAKVRRRFDRLLRGEQARFKRKARRVLRTAVNLIYHRPDPIAEGLWVEVRTADDRPVSGGNVSLTELRRNGYLSIVGARARSRSVIDGLVPDGVASVTAIYPRVARRAGGGKTRRYPSRVTRSSPVRDNVFSVGVPRAIEYAFPPHLVWRAASGRVIKVFR